MAVPRSLLVALLALVAVFAAAGSASATFSPIVISEVQARGTPAQPPQMMENFEQEFIELLNIDEEPLDVGGWAIYGWGGGTCNGSPDLIVGIPLGTTIPAGRHYLIAPSSRTEGPAADQTYTGNHIGDSGTVSLVHVSDTVDSVAWGEVSGTCGEGVSKNVLLEADDQSIERIGGRQDTDSNTADFVPRNPGFPQNLTSSPDSDSDGVSDDVDNCPSEANSDQANNDDDGAGDPCDPDDDNDSVADGTDGCPKIPGPAPGGCPVTPTPTPAPTAAPTATAVATATASPTPGVIVLPFPGPTVSEVRFEPATPVVGQTVTLILEGLDPDDVFNGAYVEFGEQGGFVGLSACQQKPIGGFPAASPFLPGTGSHVEISYVFTTPGEHVIRIHLRSGECGGTPDTSTAVAVIVVGSKAARVFAAAKSPVAKSPTAKGCKDADLRPTASNGARVVRAILCLENIERRKEGLRALKPSSVLSRAASLHAVDMVKHRFFSHESPSRGNLDTRIKRHGYRGRVGENIAGGRSTPRKLVAAFLKSPAHRTNLLGKDFRYGAVAVVASNPRGRPKPGGTFTALFGTTKR